MHGRVDSPSITTNCMREESPVMWTRGRKPTSGFWSVSRYEDVRHVELNPDIFSSQRGSMHMAVLPPSGKADRLMYAAHNSLINLDADIHRDLRIQQLRSFSSPNTSRP